MLEIVKLSDIDVTFPANPPLPKYEDVPEEFKTFDGNPYVNTANELFAHGHSKTYAVMFKPEVPEDQREDALRMVRACLGTFSCKHEHKIAGVAFMLSEWFDLKPR